MKTATELAQQIADQELQHCAGWVGQFTHSRSTDLIDARRPKPPSLKQQAMAVLNDVDAQLGAAHYTVLLRALEQLDD